MSVLSVLRRIAAIVGVLLLANAPAAIPAHAKAPVRDLLGVHLGMDDLAVRLSCAQPSLRVDHSTRDDERIALESVCVTTHGAGPTSRLAGAFQQPPKSA